MKKVAIELSELPNCDMPLAVLCRMGGVQTTTGRQWKKLDKIKTYLSHNMSFVSVKEMQNMVKAGHIKLST
jgi:hypothetical protein